jgi:ribonucleoside-diphosphate reductase alpha chain
MGLKALAIYRDGSKQSQPLSTKSEADKAAEKEKAAARPKRERLPDTRQSLTHKFCVGGHEGYINVGLYPDGRPGELFLTMAKEGSTVGGMMDAFGTAISLSLQYGVPLEVLVKKFSHMRFEPMGMTANSDIRIAKSVVDYIFRWLGITFLPGYKEANAGLNLPTADKPLDTNSGNTALAEPLVAVPRPSAVPSGNGSVDPAARERVSVALKPVPPAETFSSRSEQFAQFQTDAPSCDVCGAITIRNGTCYLCFNCGNSMGCS